MAEYEPDADQNVSDPFASASSDAEPESSSSSLSSGPATNTDPALLMNMAKMWVQEHQRASMLGAFAIGVFVGSLFRD